MKFSDLPIHPALASALTVRGYETPTGVQAAVLAPECAGRDLLVSSQTGSGKTIAFGAALAESLLGPEDKHVPHGPKPIALVVVPTRELAVQVREELGWLFNSTRLRLASFTGGTAVVGDLKTLQRGVELAIGTPGRLVDLIRRQRLDLTALRAVVLDEADEMLDLGFREDLETLLQAAPKERRTLLLSATLPPEIRALAKRYQRDALAIDPRKGGGESGQGKAAHDDIAHRAHLIAGPDRLAAVVNVLRAEESARAIVFCTRRESVAELHAALVARGFTAAAISGDRAQGERDRALEQVRNGEARVLVATNVAARGLHLPDVDLIVHADLPLNADSLVHRSGRTGRAGRKGTSVVLATAAERRKAEWLLAAAHVKPVWTAPPSADTIAANARARLAEELVAAEPVVDGAPASTGASGADDLLALVEGKLPDRELLRRLLARELARLPSGERLRAIAIPAQGDGRRNEGPPEPRRARSEFSRGGALFRVSIGAKDNADPRWLLPLICRRGGVTRRDVGAIRIGPRETTFEIAGEAVDSFSLAAAELDPRAPQIVIQRADSNAPPRRESAAPRREHAAPRRENAAPRREHAAPRREAPAPRREAPAPRREAAPASESIRPPQNEESPHRAPPDVPKAGKLPEATTDGAPKLGGDRPYKRKASAPIVVERKVPAPIVVDRKIPAPIVTGGKPHWDTLHGDDLPAEKPAGNELHKPYEAKPQAAKPFGAKPFGAKPFGDKPHGDRPFARKPFGDKPFAGKPRRDKPFGAKPFGDKPFGDRPFAGKPRGDKPFGDKPFAGKPFAGKPRGDKPFSGKPRGDKPFGDKPFGGKPFAGKPRGGKPFKDRGAR